MPSARSTLAVAALLVLAGCLGGAPPGTGAPSPDAADTDAPDDGSPSETTPAAATYTPLPDRSTPFPEGPKSPPERPAELTAESLRSYLTTYERRWVYNEMYPGPNKNYEAHVSDCEVRWLDERDVGYVAVVSCTAYAEYETMPAENGTPVRVHADWFTQSFTYLVDEDAVVRRRPTDAEARRAGV
jgi:hypothetical protein